MEAELIRGLISQAGTCPGFLGMLKTIKISCYTRARSSSVSRFLPGLKVATDWGNFIFTVNTGAYFCSINSLKTILRSYRCFFLYYQDPLGVLIFELAQELLSVLSRASKLFFVDLRSFVSLYQEFFGSSFL